MQDIERSMKLRVYETMTTIRQCEERVRSLLMAGQLMIICHSPRGHEAVSAGVGAVLRPDDSAVTTYRGMGDHIAKGVPLKALWAEYYGRATGACKGKGGPMHVTYPERGLRVTTGIVGSGLPISNGYALASKLRGGDQVTVCNFGDGASNIGAFHEALHLAALWKLPVVFVCHNNGYAEHMAFDNHKAVDRISDRAAAYGMPGETVDGCDPLAVLASAGAAVDRARSGGGPTLIEAVCTRLAGHYIGDTEDYVSAEWRAAAVALDPVPAFRARLIDAGDATEEDLAALEKRIAAELDAAVEFAQNSPFPEVEEIVRDVYAEEVRA